MASARSCVFNTPELLEAILLQLPQNDLLLAQRISRTFQAAIRSSPTIQQRLFFRETPFEHPEKWTVNPLLRQHFYPWFVIPNNNKTYKIFNYHTLERMPWARDEERRQAMLRPEASWRKMFITQPPTKDLQVYQYIHGQNGDFYQHANVSSQKLERSGLTMSVLYDILDTFAFNEIQSGTFRTVMKNTTAGPPEMWFLLRYTVQCCPWCLEEDPLESLDPEKGSVDDLKFEECPREMMGAFEEGLMNDLTVEKGGVTKWEYEEWNGSKMGTAAQSDG